MLPFLGVESTINRGVNMDAVDISKIEAAMKTAFPTTTARALHRKVGQLYFKRASRIPSPMSTSTNGASAAEKLDT